MQAHKLMITNTSLQRFFSTTCWKSRRIGWTVDEILKWKGPRCLKPHRVMGKFLEKTKKNGIFSLPPVGAPSISLQTAVTSIACRSVPETRRSSILNKMFMRNITEILATSDIGSLLYGHDIQLCRVRVRPDFGAVNVYWIPQGTDSDEEIQYLLNKVANPLRSELIGLRVMGRVPRIQFIKDKHYALMAEVDRRLKIADFGDDYVPALKDGDHLREDLQLITKLPRELKEKITRLEENEPFSENEELELPSMRADVFGLDYKKILRTVKQGISKARNSNEELEDIFCNPKAVFEIPSNAMCERQSWDKNAFKRYIKQRSIKARKARQVLSRELESMDDDKSYGLCQNEFEEYDEFIKNSFEDDYENPDDCDEKYELEQ